MRFSATLCVAAATLMAGAPALGRGGGGGDRDEAPSAAIEELRARIGADVRSGAVSRGDADQLRRQLREIARVEREYGRDGISPQERADLQGRLRALRQQLRSAGGGD